MINKIISLALVFVLFSTSAYSAHDVGVSWSDMFAMVKNLRQEVADFDEEIKERAAENRRRRDSEPKSSPVQTTPPFTYETEATRPNISPIIKFTPTPPKPSLKYEGPFLSDFYPMEEESKPFWKNIDWEDVKFMAAAALELAGILGVCYGIYKIINAPTPPPGPIVIRTIPEKLTQMNTAKTLWDPARRILIQAEHEQAQRNGMFRAERIERERLLPNRYTPEQIAVMEQNEREFFERNKDILSTFRTYRNHN